MRKFEVRYRREAIADLDGIEEFVAARSGYEIATIVADDLRDACESLAHAAQRGTLFRRGPPEIRTVGVKRMATIAFAVDVERSTVVVLGVFYRGRDVGTSLSLRL